MDESAATTADVPYATWLVPDAANVTEAAEVLRIVNSCPS
jgi:uncharacterized Fe-S cluster protein YjdI